MAQQTSSIVLDTRNACPCPVRPDRSSRIVRLRQKARIHRAASTCQVASRTTKNSLETFKPAFTHFGKQVHLHRLSLIYLGMNMP